MPLTAARAVMPANAGTLPKAHAVHSSAPVSRRPDGPVCLAGRWHISLLGRIEARNGDCRISHFNSLPTAALLARLALLPGQLHPREELADLLWPKAPAEVGRNRLRQALSTLRHLLEPPGFDGPPVLLVDRQSLRLNEHAVWCDALEFERACNRHERGLARSLYQGELMPGHYADWVLVRRRQLESLHERVCLEVAALEASTAGLSMAMASGTATARATAVEPLQPKQSDWPDPAPLPVYLMPLIGRDAELAAVQAAVAQGRLVTVHGTGGIGKTRLAVAAASGLHGFDGIAFVTLAGCSSVDQAVAQLCRSLQVAAGRRPVQGVAHALGMRRMLLVLDNLEQLAERGGDALVLELLQHAPRLHILLTSRCVLGLAGEHELLLAPLPLPEPDLCGQALATNPSVALFVAHARQVRPDFSIRARNQGALVSLCRALEGVPLAIELAAARIRVHTLQEMVVAMAQPLALLQRPVARAGRLPRHGGMQAALAWSWALLDGRAQRLLAGMTVFTRSWTVADAAAVCGEPEARMLCESLLAHAVLVVDGADAGVLRLRMLGLWRAFLVGQLEPARAQALTMRLHMHQLAPGLLARNLQLSLTGPGPEPDGRMAPDSSCPDAGAHPPVCGAIHGPKRQAI